jgi:enoyl-CoA hydratase/carnithine racemase
MSLATFAQDGGLGEIIVDSPPLNLFGDALMGGLRDAVEEAAGAEIGALLLRAEGEVFSGGADVSIFAGLAHADAASLMTRALSLIWAIEAIPVPIVALIHGRCFAGALEVALACDVIWAAEGSQIGQLEAAIGAFPFAGGVQRLASRIGAARTAEMVFGAQVYSAEDLAAWGLVERVLPEERLVGEGRAFAAQLAKGPTLAYGATKRILHAWRSGGVAEADELAPAEGPAVILSQDLQHGVEALTRSGPGNATFAGR